MAGFCPKCGTPAADDAIFCRGCGANIAEAIAAALANRTDAPTANETAPGQAVTPNAPVEQPVSQTTPSAPAPASIAPSKSGGCGTEILIIVVVFALLVVAGVGIALYLAH
jgi:hypothetical protein